MVSKCGRNIMTSDSSLESIKRLLTRFPGISSAMAYRNDEKEQIHIRFRCSDIQDLKTIAYWAYYSNCSVHASSHEFSLCGEGEDFNSDHLPCDMNFRDEEDDTPTQTEIFGVFIAEELEDRGMISADERRRLHRSWNTRRRP
jgi:hypothetical protein